MFVLEEICMPFASSVSEAVADWDLSEEEEEEEKIAESEGGKSEEEEEAESPGQEREVGLKSHRRSGVGGAGGEAKLGRQEEAEGSKRRCRMSKSVYVGVLLRVSEEGRQPSHIVIFKVIMQQLKDHDRNDLTAVFPRLFPCFSHTVTFSEV